MENELTDERRIASFRRWIRQCISEIKEKKALIVIYEKEIRKLKQEVK